jgi:hypothetical protein
VQHPYEFLTHVLGLGLGIVLAALQRLRQSLRSPPLDTATYLGLALRRLSVFKPQRIAAAS